MRMLDQFDKRYNALKSSPVGPLLMFLLSESIEHAKAGESFLGPCHLTIQVKDYDDQWLVITPDIPDRVVVGVGFVLPANLPLDKQEDLALLLQFSIQGPYLRASDMDLGQRHGWFPKEDVCPGCGKIFVTYLQLWGHVFLDHGRVRNPFNREQVLIEPLL